MSDAPTLHIRGNVLLDDDRELGDLWVRGGRVSLTRPSAQGAGMRVIEGWALPGLVDAHCHIGLAAEGAVPHDVAARQAVADRDSGVLVVRDAGSPSDTRWVQARGDLPRLIRAGTHLALARRYLRNFARELDDPAELPAAVREEALRGDGWVKLVGDWIDRSLPEGGDLTPLWPGDVLARAVAAAHAEAARVTVHTFATETVDALLDAGVDGIEHGTGMTAEQISRAAEAGVAVTPTLLQVAQFEAIAAQAEPRYPVFAKRMRHLHARRYQQVRDFYDAGVRLLVGTDAGGTIGHGRIADECAELVAAGVPAAEVVAMASWRARSFLGLGAVVEGSSADLVVYPEDPRENIDVLRYPTAIVLRGELY
ncbi:amidohydrolase family protein [Myceligenerans pegani]|uniref:Amidohydrolase family protein n=1 Tax=Myceligenerans pegani TaxID=2776917 RepID=A0ABR9MZF3_9MICO|nr:amidohydrolase family protein [Myceligenerans sp. TRM 65318]MBE1876233.1 amidohydrolase family protein [Myceligenerans sp. TRM 65318]MBE3018504.1 amidohydrolase family protein [Myceligenerans sp. TRM 65318]